MDDRGEIAAHAAELAGLADLRVAGPRSAVAEIQEKSSGGRPGCSAEPDGKRRAEVCRLPSAPPALSHPCRGPKGWTMDRPEDGLSCSHEIDPEIDLEADRLHEECGVFGIFGHPDAAAITALGLHALQHRGQEAA